MRPLACTLVAVTAACAQGAEEGAAARRGLQQRATDPPILTFGRLPDTRGRSQAPAHARDLGSAFVAPLPGRAAGSADDQTPSLAAVRARAHGAAPAAPAPESAAGDAVIQRHDGARAARLLRSAAAEAGGAAGNPAPDPPIPIDMPGHTFLADRGGLPRNVALATLKRAAGGRVLLRLAHLLQARRPRGAPCCLSSKSVRGCVPGSLWMPPCAGAPGAQPFLVTRALISWRLHASVTHARLRMPTQCCGMRKQVPFRT